MFGTRERWGEWRGLRGKGGWLGQIFVCGYWLEGEGPSSLGPTVLDPFGFELPSFIYNDKYAFLKSY